MIFKLLMNNLNYTAIRYDVQEDFFVFLFTSGWLSKFKSLYDLTLRTSKHVRNAIIEAEVTMSEQNNRQVSTLQRPATNNREDWKAYWKQQGQPWRTEQEVDTERQEYLTERRKTTPNIEQGIYPFKDIKLSRADIEWLLATHEDGRGPVDWDDKGQRRRNRLDVRGANLRHVDLRDLPLTRLHGGLSFDEGDACH